MLCMAKTTALLKRARLRVDETQEEFACRFGIDRSTYAGWENYGPPQQGTAAVLIERVLAELAVQAAE